MTSPPDDLETLPPIERARRALEWVEYHRAEVGRYAAIRLDAITELRATMTVKEVAAALGVSTGVITKPR